MSTKEKDCAPGETCVQNEVSHLIRCECESEGEGVSLVCSPGENSRKVQMLPLNWGELQGFFLNIKGDKRFLHLPLEVTFEADSYYTFNFNI